ncbi:MAG: MATE family efflux transporter [Methanocorpusculum sp.]|nr:MATE family efflux transporter [Methanocorpusculum sp.]
MIFKNKVDLLHGSVFKGLILFTLPLIGTSLIQLMFSTADMIFAGNFLGDAAAAAVGASTLIVYFSIAFLVGLSTGAGVIISSHFGAGNKNKLQKSLQNSVIISIAFGIILTLLSFLLSPLILTLTNVPSDLFETAASYCRIYSLSIVFASLYNFGFAALRSISNSKKPFIFLAIGGVANITLNAVFILIFHMGVNGLAWATFISQMIIVICVYREIQKKTLDNPIRINRLHIDPYYIKKILWIGIPIALQLTIIIFSNLFIQSQINLFGDDTMAAFYYYYKIDNLVWMVTVAFGQAVTVFVSQNLGAGNILRAREGVKKCMMLGVAGTLVMNIIIMLFSTPLMSVFTHDAHIIQISIEILFIIMPLYCIFAVVEILNGALKGAGKTFAAMVIILVNFCLVRIIFLYLFQTVSLSVNSIAMVYPASWITVTICLAVYYKLRPMKSEVY